MRHVRMIFSSDLQAAADELVKWICNDAGKRAMVIAPYRAIDERWRRAVSALGNGCSVSIVRGTAKEKNITICMNAQIIFVSPGGAEKILRNRDIKTDILIADDLESLIGIREKNKKSISAIAHDTTQIIGISCGLKKEYLRYVPEAFRILGMDKMKGMSPNGFYERFYYRNYIKKGKDTICRLELKPGAFEAVKKLLGEICDMQMLGKEEKADRDMSGYEEYIPLDYKEKSKYRFIKRLQEAGSNGNGIGYHNGQFV
ncbi:MAG: hypothetical protein K5697_12120 [Lachnospiraceae bacterium]|nr:hypothetical protein [Lachnospiraceae bacterium]